MKNRQDDCIQILYGINRAFEVKSVYVYRSGKMTCGFNTHCPQHGNNAQTEAAIVFNLSDILSVPPVLADSEHTQKQIDALQAKADEMKNVAATNATSGSPTVSATAPSVNTTTSGNNVSEESLTKPKN
ncbi:MAG: hypothetical protein KBC53_08855 [Nitrosomonas sp.]|nr:hypothetical protein [Nitrosomonas sp.]